MSLFPKPLTEWFRGICDRFFFAAVRVSAEGAVADLEARSIEVKKQRVRQLQEALDFADELALAGDGQGYKEQALAAFRKDLLEIRQVTDQVLGGRIPFEEGPEALRDLPPGSGGSGTGLPAGPPPAARPALPDGRGHNGPTTPSSKAFLSDSPGSPPPKRPRGRPRKYPRPESNGPGGGPPHGGPDGAAS